MVQSLAKRNKIRFRKDEIVRPSQHRQAPLRRRDGRIVDLLVGLRKSEQRRVRHD